MDEVLWRAQVHPARSSQTLTAEEATAIHDQTIAVLSQAVEKAVPPFGPIPMPLGKMEACRIFIRSMIRLVKDVYAVVPSLRKFN